MTDPRPAELEATLTLKTRELNLILAIDKIRDTTPEPIAMLTAIVDLLAREFAAELCAIAVVDRNTEQVEVKAIHECTTEQMSFLINRAIVEQATALSETEIWASEALQRIGGFTSLPDDVFMVAVPVIMGKNEHLGTVLLARRGHAFSAEEAQLLDTAEDQIDSAVIQGFNYYELQQRVRELETIYRIDQIRDQELPFDQMLNTVLQELRQTIPADMGFIMLYDRTGRQLELRATTHDDLLSMSPYHELIHRAAYQALDMAALHCYEHQGDTIDAIMCLPLILNSQIIGVLGVARRAGQGRFNQADQRLLNAIGSQMDTAIFESLEKRRLRDVLDRSVGPHILDRLLASSETDFLKGERSELSVLYADIRGSTSLAEQTDPELLVGFINHYLSRMTEIILGHDATLDKFIGDEVMALFGAPFAMNDHAFQAVKVGLEMQAAYDEVQSIWHERGVFAGPIGVGIATGELIVGEMGSPQRADYTAIGRAANLGARICSIAQGGQVLISQATYDIVRSQVRVRAISGMQFKGVAGAVTVYQVLELID